ncbi:metal ABC transporter solute-binding protein, Zn/Mn family [Aliarcobacter butzleri]|uniref:metal ABC transporter solute-binding protein, Zn/Mn family n=1 Tax=Aliarcobacter butzleri TaxID=28197 RepID=UPI003AF615C6
MKKFLVLFLVFASFLYANKPQLTVNILPQKYFVEKIVKDKFDINVMVKPGSSPHNFEPKPSQMKSLASSKVYFLVGDPSEQAWIEKFKQNAKDTLFVDTTVGIERIPMVAHKHHDEEDEDEHEGHAHHEHEHEHEEHADHAESGLDPHTWLDPISVKVQAKNIYEAMLKIDEKNGDFYKTNYEEFLKELDSLDSEIKNILVPYKDKAFMVFHPSWGYFAKRYDLEQISIEMEGKEPKPNELVKLIEEAKKHDIKIVFVAPQFSQKSAKTISESIGANVVSIDPLSGDWKNDLLKTAKEIANSYK